MIALCIIGGVLLLAFLVYLIITDGKRIDDIYKITDDIYKSDSKYKKFDDYYN